MVSGKLYVHAHSQSKQSCSYSAVPSLQDATWLKLTLLGRGPCCLAKREMPEHAAGSAYLAERTCLLRCCIETAAPSDPAPSDPARSTRYQRRLSRRAVATRQYLDPCASTAPSHQPRLTPSIHQLPARTQALEKMKLVTIPGPPGRPLVGNAWDVDAENPLQSLCSLTNTYGRCLLPF